MTIREHIEEMKRLARQYEDRRISKGRMLKTMNALCDDALAAADEREREFERAREAAAVLETCGLLSEYSDEALAIILAYFNPAKEG